MLDNAPYHHAHSENKDYVNVSELTKDGAHGVLIKAGVDRIHGVRGGQPCEWAVNSLKDDSGKIARAPKGPTSDEMKAAVRNVIKCQYPEWNKSDV